jgi:YVTN family beta-propeller protein
MALTADGSILCVANPDSDSLSLVDIKTSSLLVEIPVGDDPRAVAAGTKFAYVTNHGSDSISIIDLESQTRVADLPIGDRPVGVALSPGYRFLVVAEMGQDSVRFIETKTLQTLVAFPVPDRPYGLTFTPDGRALLVTHLHSGEITRIPVQPYASYFPYTIFKLNRGGSTTCLWQLSGSYHQLNLVRIIIFPVLINEIRNVTWLNVPLS